MIYDTIASEIQEYLGEDFDIRYANNYTIDWKGILPEMQEKMSFGVLKVDSGRTTQISNQNVRVEQLTLTVAIPVKSEIFNAAVVNLKTLIKEANNTTIVDTETSESANLFFGEYQDNGGTTVNGVKWWLVSVTFAINLYNDMYTSSDVSVTIGGTAMTGIIDTNYSREFVVDSLVMVNGLVPANKVNNMKKTLRVDCVCLKSDTLISGLMTNENSITSYNVIYYNGMVTRTFTALLGLINEQNIVGDILKVSLVFVEKQ